MVSVRRTVSVRRAVRRAVRRTMSFRRAVRKDGVGQKDGVDQKGGQKKKDCNNLLQSYVCQ